MKKKKGTKMSNQRETEVIHSCSELENLGFLFTLIERYRQVIFLCFIPYLRGNNNNICS